MCLYGFVGLRIRACARKHETSFAVPCFGTKACSCILGFTGFLTMTQPLTTADERTQLLANGTARAAGQGIDPMPVVRLFTPDAHATWLLVSLDPADGDTAYGLIDLGIGMPALGTVKLSDLASIVGPQQRPVLRDVYFRAARPLSEYVRLAQRDGSIPD
ncbi:conserved hypothetical protein [Burkholderia multivorans CGD2M]|uniref:Lipoprotein n=2 Tax=Burkholderia multivorans TaxID=87883 RepID=B9BUG7_9BURK|nr:conserved hypothetical protein [Burkholderia multivorans CGD2]EEE11737.1 conserved hypothetical protein [Burkholderia multivorans CGD2M]